MSPNESLRARVLEVRRATDEIAEPLNADDCGAQSMPDASPIKWHLAHTTWFFETFVVTPALEGYSPHRPGYERLFNSYYESIGARIARDKRSLITRPSLDEVRSYRRAIDTRLAELDIGALTKDAAFVLELGLQHEQQHQELMYTDIKHLFRQHPLEPCYSSAPPHVRNEATPHTWVALDGGTFEIGQGPDEGFGFDNERPRHAVSLANFEIGGRLVNCGEWREFVNDRGYDRAELWLSDGWTWLKTHEHRAPLYWNIDEGSVFTLGGARAIDDAEPVCHVSYYEADAFARWAGARLPTEFEWEVFARRAPASDRQPTLENVHENPRGIAPGLFGEVWQWTSSAYAPYPGFRAFEGALGEYNGKFMVNQMVLRGSSCFTPPSHARLTYRNFFPPSAQWQMSGVRLARDA